MNLFTTTEVWQKKKKPIYLVVGVGIVFKVFLKDIALFISYYNMKDITGSSNMPQESLVEWKFRHWSAIHADMPYNLKQTARKWLKLILKITTAYYTLFASLVRETLNLFFSSRIILKGKT